MPTPEIKTKDAPPAGRSAGVRIGVWGFALPLLCLALWYLVTSLKLVPPLLVPSPTATFRRLVGLFLHEHLTSDIGATAWRWGCGYILGCLIGVPFGLFIGNSRKVYAASYPTLDFFRSLPVTALFPLFLLLFGIGDSAKIAMAFSAALFVVILNCAYGALQAKETRLRAARAFGASEGQVFRRVGDLDRDGVFGRALCRHSELRLRRAAGQRDAAAGSAGVRGVRRASLPLGGLFRSFAPDAVRHADLAVALPGGGHRQ